MALNKTPFASVQELAKSMCISTATVLQCLKRSLGFIIKHLHWVPHSLTEAQRQIRIFDENHLKRASHPPYSSDFASSDFFLLGHTKKLFSGHSFVASKDLLKALREVLAGIPHDTLKRIFTE
jgi:hypothetical protein